jgi:hypothetical protein
MRSVPPLVFVALLGSAACAPAGSSAYISGNVPLSGECVPGDGNVLISTGLWDVLKTGTKKTTCLKPYRMSMVINSNLRANSNLAVGRAEPNALLVNYADVTLLDKDESPIGFDALKGAPPPNPYRVYTAVSIPPTADDNPSQGFVTIDAIPTAYAEVLRRVAQRGDSILVQVQLFGKTTGDVDVDFAPFLYPLALCQDCLSTCMTDPMWAADPASLSDLNADKCTDKRAQDDRTCIDPC